MAKHLKPKDVDAIVHLILNWKGEKLTWDVICESCQPLIGKRPTRQSLSKNPDIVAAYESLKEAQKNSPALRQPTSLGIAAGRIASLERQNERLKEENRRLKQQFVVWQYNAYRRGLKEHDLNQPLPLIDRGRDDGERR